MSRFKLNSINAGVFALIALTTMPAQAQQKVEEVFITGSAIRRIVSDEALPIQVITKDEIKSFGSSVKDYYLYASTKYIVRRVAPKRRGRPKKVNI